MMAGRRIAVFVGAGASAHFGVPVTKELLPETFRRLQDRRLYEGAGVDPEGDRKLLNRFFEAAGMTATEPRFLISEVLSLLDEMLRTGATWIAGMGAEDLRRVRVLVERAILEAVEDCKIGCQDDLEVFARWIVGDRQRDRRVSLISTNYDICLEGKLYDLIDRWDPDYQRARDKEDASWLGEHVDFGTAFRNPATSEVIYPPPPSRARLATLKLHGAFNWLKCPLCMQVYINPYTSGLAYLQEMGRGKNNQCVCGHSPLERLLVAPSLVRDLRDTALLSIWRTAMEDLRVADQWVIVGFSLPVEDLSVRSLLLRAYGARRERPRVLVVQLDRTEEEGYRRLLPGCDYREGGMGALIEEIRREPGFLMG